MSRIQLRIYDLRKRKQIGQRELAEQLGVSVQTVSKWENDISMPDISLLPDIAAFFQVTVDEVLGMKPLPGEEYIPVRSGEKDYWESRLNYLKASRKSFWNEDYLEFLVKKVWKIEKPVQVKEGLVDVDVRMNDRVCFVTPGKADYAESVKNLMAEKQWEKACGAEEEEKIVQQFINHGMDRKEAESYCRKQRKIQAYVEKNKENLTYLQWRGLVISYGRKA